MFWLDGLCRRGLKFERLWVRYRGAKTAILFETNGCRLLSLLLCQCWYVERRPDDRTLGGCCLLQTVAIKVSFVWYGGTQAVEMSLRFGDQFYLSLRYVKSGWAHRRLGKRSEEGGDRRRKRGSISCCCIVIGLRFGSFSNEYSHPGTLSMAFITIPIIFSSNNLLCA